MTRTVCDCPGCVACCVRQPGPLAPGDFERIVAALALSDTEALAAFVASPGAVAMDRAGTVYRVGTITPARGADGACVFLDDAGRCRIHAVAPFGCSHFDPHMDAAEGHRRATWLLRQQMTDDYQRLRAQFAPARR